MYYKGLTWKFKLLLMSCCLLTGPLTLFLFYREHGRLSYTVVVGIFIASLLGCSLVVLGDHSWRKYYMSKETTTDKSEEQ